MSALPIANRTSGLRQRMGEWVDSKPVQGVIITLIVLNAVTLGMQTSPSIVASIGGGLHLFDVAVLSVFVAELLIKLYAYGWRFFRSGWNVFDLIVVTIALVPASGPMAVLRSLRILRVLRLISVVPKMRFVVEALLHAVPGIASIAALLLLIYYVFAVIATNLFGPDFPQWFGTLGNSMYTLFQVMTLESWSMGISRPVMERFPWAWTFFVPFILVATFTMLNLFIAIIVNTMQELHNREAKQEMEALRELAEEEKAPIEAEIRALREDVKAMRELLEAQAGQRSAAIIARE